MTSTSLTEAERYAAEAILDRYSADPDDDPAIVARAALRLGHQGSAPLDAEWLDRALTESGFPPSEAIPPRADLREQLAALEHEQWEKWSRTVAEQGLTPERIERWQRYWVPYAELDEATKDFDREWADKALALMEIADPDVLDRLDRMAQGYFG